MNRKDLILLVCFAAAVMLSPILLTPIGAGYPDLLQKIANGFCRQLQVLLAFGQRLHIIVDFEIRFVLTIEERE